MKNCPECGVFSVNVTTGQEKTCSTCAVETGCGNCQYLVRIVYATANGCSARLILIPDRKVGRSCDLFKRMAHD